MIVIAVLATAASTWMCVPGRSPDIHPTTTGYQVIADAYLAKISG